MFARRRRRRSKRNWLLGRVLDVGTGTGILAIVGARLGAESVDAVDIDPVAVQVARQNVEHNGIAMSWKVG